MGDHGKHCDCMVCSMGKAVGMVGECSSKDCKSPTHKKKEDEE